MALIPFGIALESRCAHPGARARPFRTGFSIGYLGGFVLFLLALHWIAFLTPTAVTVPGIMFPAWPAAAAYAALFPALAAAVVCAARVRFRVPVAWTLPLFWIAAEKLRSVGELSFPWLSLGYTQWQNEPVLQWAAVGSVPLTGLWVAGANGFGIAAVMQWRAGRHRAGGWLALAGLLWIGAAHLGGSLLVPDAAGEKAGSRVALVQGNVARDIKWDRSRNQEVLQRFLDMSRVALSQDAELLLWPETATGNYLRRDPLAYRQVRALVDSSGVPLVTGYPDWVVRDSVTVDSYNAAGLFLPRRGIVSQYAKMHLVPFGERLPFQRVFPALGRLELGQAEWTPGDSLVLLATAADTVAVLICFESIFPELARDARREGASLLAVLTNDQWFGRTGALYQHAAMSVFRAVETRLPLARCANTGITFFVDIAGRVYESSDVFTREIRIARLDRKGPETPYVRWGDWLGTALLWAMGVTAVVCGFRRRPAF